MDFLVGFQIAQEDLGNAVKAGYIDDLLEQNLQILQRGARRRHLVVRQVHHARIGRPQCVADERHGAVNVQHGAFLAGRELRAARHRQGRGRRPVVTRRNFFFQECAQAVFCQIGAQGDLGGRGGAVPQVIPEGSPEWLVGALQVGGGEHTFQVELKTDHARADLDDGVTVAYLDGHAVGLHQALGGLLTVQPAHRHAGDDHAGREIGADAAVADQLVNG